MLSHVLYASHYISLGAKPLHDVYHEKSHFIEVDTWLGDFDMTLGSMWGVYNDLVMRIGYLL